MAKANERELPPKPENAGVIDRSAITAALFLEGLVIACFLLLTIMRLALRNATAHESWAKDRDYAPTPTVGTTWRLPQPLIPPACTSRIPRNVFRLDPWMCYSSSA